MEVSKAQSSRSHSKSSQRACRESPHQVWARAIATCCQITCQAPGPVLSMLHT